MSKHHNPKLDAKKAAVLKSQKNKINPVPILLGVLVMLCAAAVGYFLTKNANHPAQPPVAAAPDSAQVIYPVGMFQDGLAHHFDYQAGDLTIRYFVIKSSDGVIRAAFDACDVCWPAGKGYYQERDDMVCRNCGRRFASLLVNEVQGGCNPAPLNRTVQGDKMIIKVEEIIKGRSYFDFNRKA